MTLMSRAAPAAAISIRMERPGDIFARESLLDKAFGLGRRRMTSERLREGRAPARGLSLTATDGDLVIGTIRLWHIHAGGVDALMLGPLAVASSHRSLGIGARLIGEALFRAVQHGHKAVLVVGDAPYYSRFGFSRAATARLALPGPVEAGRFLGLELETGALDGAAGLVRATGDRLALPKRPRAA